MTETVMIEMIRYFGPDAKRINHALKVHGFTETICGLEKVPTAKQETAGLAAILHDIGIKEAELKYNSTAGNFQEQEGPPIARKILERCGVADAVIDRVCLIIGNHHSYDRIDGIDFRILVEADFIVNAFEDAMGKKQIETVRNKIFKTGAGTAILASMYLV